ncbi:MAG TPA: protein kinase [Gallionellaceae bacterium]|nr:protein kinase [Gallionellaceae bacterium]
MASHLGRYEILEELGRGSMGVVYRANDPLIGRQVAIKTVNLHDLAPEKRKEYETRFHQEAKAAGSLNHPNIVTIYDLGRSGDEVFIAMELLEGRQLHDDTTEFPRLPPAEALEIAAQVADGLAYAHRGGIVHRDIKPSNIMLVGEHLAKIADFGIAQISAPLISTRTGMIIGSPLYMSPEQILSSGTDARSDIFSLGIVLYQMLTGQRPFSGNDAHSVMYKIVNEEPPSLGSHHGNFPPALEAIVSRCLAKKPQDRYQDAGELANDLRACRNQLLGIPATTGYSALMGAQLKRMASPGAVPPWLLAAAFVSIGLIFMFDLSTGDATQMHLLYIFPLVLISYHCRQVKLVYAAVGLALVLQGVILIGFSTLSPFSRALLALLAMPSNVLIAYIARVARANFLAIDHLAPYDDLTGLYNRTLFESLTELEVSRQQRSHGAFSLAVVTIANLAEVRRTNGPQAVDGAVRLLAKILREHIRHSDIAARIAEDKFAIMMPDTGAAGCDLFCRQIAVKIKTLMRKAAVPAIVRIGHVTPDQAPASAAELFDRADGTMHDTRDNAGKDAAAR